MPEIMDEYLFALIIFFIGIAIAVIIQLRAKDKPTLKIILLIASILAISAVTYWIGLQVGRNECEELVEITSTPSIKDDSINDEMFLIHAGEFSMGISFEDFKERDYYPSHLVYLDSFLIDKFEITNAEYKVCVDEGACNEPSERDSNSRINYFNDLEKFGNYPVIYVNWNDANNYCEWRGGKLPTEAEWEKAAGYDSASERKYLFPWGPEYISNYANYNSDDTVEVGLYEFGKSQSGVYDLAGNVLEWVSDLYEADYYNESTITNPKGPKSFHNNHVARGGSWASKTENEIWTIFRYAYEATRSSYDLGFRCAKDG